MYRMHIKCVKVCKASVPLLPVEGGCPGLGEGIRGRWPGGWPIYTHTVIYSSYFRTHARNC